MLLMASVDLISMLALKCSPGGRLPTLALNTIEAGVVVLVDNHVIHFGVVMLSGRTPFPDALNATVAVAEPADATSWRELTVLARLARMLSVTGIESVTFAARSVTPTLIS